MSAPIGYILHFPPGTEIPKDYLELNGRNVSVDEYPELCRTLVWAVGNMRYRVDGTHFRLPAWNMSVVWPNSRFAIRARDPNFIEEPWQELVDNRPIALSLHRRP